MDEEYIPIEPGVYYKLMNEFDSWIYQVEKTPAEIGKKAGQLMLPIVESGNRLKLARLVLIMAIASTKQGKIESALALQSFASKALMEVEKPEEKERRLEHAVREAWTEKHNLALKTDWDTFEAGFLIVFPDFLPRLKSVAKKPLTDSENRVCIAELTALEIDAADALLCLARRSIQNARNSIRKKLDLPKGENLHEYLKSLAELGL